MHRLGDCETGSLTLEKNGDFTLLIGAQSNGQGHETAYAQAVSQYLDVPLSASRSCRATPIGSDRLRHRRIAIDSRSAR